METVKTTSKCSKFVKYRINAPQLLIKNKNQTKLQSIIARTTGSTSNINSFQLTPKQSQRINDLQKQNICRTLQYKSRYNTSRNINKNEISQDRTRTALNKLNQQRKIIYLQNQKKLKQYINSISQKGNQNSNSKSSQSAYHEDKNNMLKKEENKRFMKRELSFTQNDQEQIHLQKQALEQYENQRGIQNHKMSIIELSKNKLAYLEIKISNCHKTIQKIYHCIQQMQKIGYQKRSNQSIIAYCLNKRKWLSNVFLQQHKKNIDSNSLHPKYMFVPSAEEAKLSFSNFVSKVACNNINNMSEDIEGLLEYVEEMLGYKKIVELHKVSQYLQEKFNSVKTINKMDSEFHIEYLNFHIQNVDHQKFNFIDNIKKIQQKFGNMPQISKESRRKYENLNQTYDRMQNLL